MITIYEKTLVALHVTGVGNGGDVNSIRLRHARRVCAGFSFVWSC